MLFVDIIEEKDCNPVQSGKSKMLYLRSDDRITKRLRFTFTANGRFKLRISQKRI